VQGWSGFYVCVVENPVIMLDDRLTVMPLQCLQAVLSRRSLRSVWLHTITASDSRVVFVVSSSWLTNVTDRQTDRHSVAWPILSNGSIDPEVKPELQTDVRSGKTPRMGLTGKCGATTYPAFWGLYPAGGTTKFTFDFRTWSTWKFCFLYRWHSCFPYLITIS